LFVYLIAVVCLAEKFAIPLDNGIDTFGMPPRSVERLSLHWVLSPEALKRHSRGVG